MKYKTWFYRILFYILGMLLLALGIGIGIGIGTIVAFVGVGRVIWAYNRLWKEKFEKLTGIGSYPKEP